MRTTANIDDDLYRIVVLMAAEEKKAVGKVISQLLREAVAPPKKGEQTTEWNRFPLFEANPSAGVITNGHINRIRGVEE